MGELGPAYAHGALWQAVLCEVILVGCFPSFLDRLFSIRLSVQLSAAAC